jgi:hypothetical protein
LKRKIYDPIIPFKAEKNQSIPVVSLNIVCMQLCNGGDFRGGHIHSKYDSMQNKMSDRLHTPKHIINKYP